MSEVPLYSIPCREEVPRLGLIQDELLINTSDIRGLHDQNLHHIRP